MEIVCSSDFRLDQAGVDSLSLWNGSIGGGIFGCCYGLAKQDSWDDPSTKTPVTTPLALTTASSRKIHIGSSILNPASVML
jgi:hypothetical protein